MRKYQFIAILLVLGFSSSCKKSPRLKHTVHYTTDKNAFRRVMGPDDTAYTDFGNYVTSITPFSVKAKMNIMGYQDDWKSNAHMISYIDGHDNDPRFEIALYADFSGNVEVKPEPILYSTDMRDGVFEQKTVTFNYFIFVPYYIDLEFALPSAYNGLKPDMLNEIFYDSANKRTVCKAKEFEMTKFIYPKYNSKVPGGYCFGNTDSTYIYNKDGLSLENSAERPFGGPDYRQPVIRSNHFTPSTVSMPAAGETIEMISIISYNTEGIIQVYAGPDNIAYTKDDMFVYAPKYWERIKVKLETR